MRPKERLGFCRTHKCDTNLLEALSKMSQTVQNILREPEVLRVMGFSHFKLWDDVRKGEFPPPIKIGVRAVGWLSDEITAHQNRLKAERDTHLAKRGAAQSDATQ